MISNSAPCTLLQNHSLYALSAQATDLTHVGAQVTLHLHAFWLQATILSCTYLFKPPLTTSIISVVVILRFYENLNYSLYDHETKNIKTKLINL